jgi:hypothetical protein
MQEGCKTKWVSVLTFAVIDTCSITLLVLAWSIQTCDLCEPDGEGSRDICDCLCNVGECGSVVVSVLKI